jgi:tetratricopeptide (TPR) repeat protein
MYSKAMELYVKVKDSKGDQGFGRACNNIAVSKKNQGKYSESLEMFMKSLEIDKRQKNIDELGKTLNNIGLLYLELNDVSKGIEYFNQAYEALCQSGNENGIAAVYINLGKAHLLQKRYSKAESYYQKGLGLAKKMHQRMATDSYEVYIDIKGIREYK